MDKKIYAEVLEEEALNQFNKACEHPAFEQGALMADAHVGYSMPIGGVVALNNHIVPAWVGYDIGCGMCAIKTGLKLSDVKGKEKELYDAIIEFVPVGEGQYNDKPANISNLRQILPFKGAKISQLFTHLIPAQLGTLGGGNHFIEVSYDEKEDVVVVIHSGSRGVGWKVADVYMGFDEKDFGYNLNSKLGQQYLKDMTFCLEFALLNRKKILDKVEKAFKKALEMRVEFDWKNTLINRNHNHAEVKIQEKHIGFGSVAYIRRVIHRKGATHAEKDMLGVIPGNMRDGSFIVKGLGNEEALCSSSHGAGRVLSRTKAKEILSMDEFTEQMEGIVGTVDLKRLDEAPDAYKNIFEVIEIQEDAGILEVVSYLKPIVNVKG